MAKIAGLQGTDVLNEPRGAALNTNTLHQLQEDVIIAALRRPILGSTIKGAGVSELRSLERQGLVTSSLDPDGQVRWRITEKLGREEPNELDHPQDLDS